VSKRVIVFGAGGAVGEATAHALVASGWSVIGSMHKPRPEAEARLRESGVEIRYDDLELPGEWAEVACGCEAIVFVTHLNLATLALSRMPAGDQRIVVFSSNNVAIQPKAKAYAELAQAERSVQRLRADVAIIRPTLIYGDPRLSTVTRLMRLARRAPLLPMPGRGLALVQPVFHEDLARAAAWLAGASGAATYAIGGPENVTMRAFYRAIVKAADAKTTRVVAIPRWLLLIFGPVLNLLGLFSQEQSARADRDRLAVRQSPPPPQVHAKVGLKEGLARLALALREEGAGSPAGGARK